MFADIPPAVRAEICKVLTWFDEHPRGKWEDMGALKDVYDEWWDVIHGKSALVDHPLIVLHSSTMQTVPRLSADGRLFMTEPQAGREKHRGRKPDTDKDDDQRIYCAWMTRQYRRKADLARELTIDPDVVKQAIDRQRKRVKKAIDRQRKRG
jgi:hypothetical protein